MSKHILELFSASGSPHIMAYPYKI